MYVEQKLTTCEVCCDTLAIQYAFQACAVRAWSRDRLTLRFFACPECGHLNPLFTPLHVGGFVVKVVPGPEPGADPRVHHAGWPPAPPSRG